jgi:hypothetical protein
MSATPPAAARSLPAPIPPTSGGPTTTVGHDALNTKAQQLLDGPLAGLVFIKKGAVYGATGLGFMAFDLIAKGGDTPVVSGFDVAVINDHRISELWTVLTKPPA